MTVPTTSNRQDFVCAAGALGPISFPHRIDAPGDLQLWTRDGFGSLVAQAIQNADYFVTVAPDFQSATVTLAAAFATANDGTTCSLLRIIPLNQPLAVASVQRFSDGELEKAYDQGVMRTQQIEESLATLRAIVDTTPLLVEFGTVEDSDSVSWDFSVPGVAKANAAVDTRPFVILTTGQSNFALAPSFAWAPAANLRVWNFSGADGNVGTAFGDFGGVATTSNPAWKMASDIAATMPGRTVYLINIAIGSTAIAKWFSGASSPDMYSNVRDNVEAALALLSVTAVDLCAWWQGEDDAPAPSTYLADFETVFDGFKAETWFPVNTPVVVFGISSTAISGISTFSPFNDTLQQVVSAETENRIFTYPAAYDASFWMDSPLVHMTGQGYYLAGADAAKAYLTGVGRRVLADMSQNPQTGYYTLRQTRVDLPQSGEVRFRNNADSAWLSVMSMVVDNFVLGNSSIPFFINGSPSPLINNVFSIGGSGLRWTEIFATNGTINTSDLRHKDVLGPLPVCLSVVERVNPIRFQWKEGRDRAVHWGFGAQDIVAAMEGMGEFAGVRETPDGYMMAAHEMLPVLWKAVQELTTELRRLSALDAAKG